MHFDVRQLFFDQYLFDDFSFDVAVASSDFFERVFERRVRDGLHEQSDADFFAFLSLDEGVLHSYFSDFERFSSEIKNPVDLERAVVEVDLFSDVSGRSNQRRYLFAVHFEVVEADPLSCLRDGVQDALHVLVDSKTVLVFVSISKHYGCVA